MLAGIWGLAIIALFMILWYRLPGLIATLGLMLYALIILTLFKLIPVTLTASGIAGFILTVGMAVDANILIFERMKEEMRAGKQVPDAIKEGFSRAWFSIRDGNFTAILTAIILFYTTTSLVRGFALTLILGVAVSMFTAISVTRTLLMAIAPKNVTPAVRFLFGSGLSR
jgi:protein-export membrane protein SecD